MPKTAASKKIAVIILNFNNADDTVECAKSLSQFEGQTCSIIVVDNCSTDNSIDTLAEGLKTIDHHLIVSPENHGYAAGNNLGIKYAISNDYDYICILNNDTLVIDNSISQLASFLSRDHRCSVAGPAIREYRQPDIVQSAGAEINILTGSIDPLYAGTPFIDLPPSSYACGYIGGACMMFRACDFERLGYIPENYFLFFEETEWCYQATKHVGPVKCVPTLSILHKGSASISKNNVNKSELIAKNRVVFEKRNATPLEFVIFALIYLIVSVFSVVLHGKSSLERFRLFSQGVREAKGSLRTDSLKNS